MNTKPLASSIFMVALGASYPAAVNAEAVMALEEVVVTAEKRSTSVQDVPIAVSALLGNALKEQDIKDANDLASLVPNMQVGFRANNAVVNLRGVETNIAFNEVSSPAVAFHLDGVYMASMRGGSALFNDVERVEVSRGPQGTLAGRNSTAGSINVVTKRPGYEFESGLEVGVGNYDKRSMSGFLNVPLIDDRLAMRLNFLQSEHDGYQINDSVNPEIENADDEDLKAFRASFLYEPSDDLSIFVKAYYEEYGGAGPQFVPFMVPEDARQSQWGDLVSQFGYPIPTSWSDPDDPRAFPLDTQPINDVEVSGLTTEITWDVDELTFTYLGNYHKDHNKVSKQDLDGLSMISDGTGAKLPAPGFQAGGSLGPYKNDAEQFSHEFRVASNDDSALNWVAGLYYFETDQQSNRQIVIVGDLGMLPNYGYGFDIYDVPSDAESYAGYFDAKYRVSDEWEVFAGIRHTEDESSKAQQRNNVLGGRASYQAFPKSTASFDGTDWRAGATWYVNEDSMIYASVSTGYKSGGTSSEEGPFDAEEVTAYEIGTKNTFYDGRLRLNASLFYNDYDGIQLGAVQTKKSGDPGVVIDVMPAEVFGFEVESVALVGDATKVSLSVGYLDTEIGDFTTCDPVLYYCGGTAFDDNKASIQGNHLPKAPEWSVSFGAEHVISLGEFGTLVPKIQSRFTDKQYLSQFNQSYDVEGSFIKTNLYLTYNSPDEKFFAQAFVKNLEDEDTRNQILLGLVTFTHAQWDAPRTTGFRVGYRWD